MTVMGIDPGIATIGFGVIRSERGRHEPVQFGVIRTEAGLPLGRRLLALSSDLTELIARYKPDAMAVEELFFNTNVTTGIQVAHGRGVILLEGFRAGVPLAEYTPSQVKQAVVGYGKAEKQQVMEMTQKLLGLPRIPRPDDAADALAIAICHACSASSLLGRFSADD